MLVSQEISMQILFLKLEPPHLLRWFLSLSQANAKNRSPSITNGDVTFPHSLPISTVPFLQFPRGNWSSCVPYPLISPHFTSMIEAIYYCCKTVVRKTLPAAPVDTFYKSLTIFFLTVLPLIIYATLSLALKSLPWRVVKLFRLCEVCLLLYSSKGVE